MEFTDVELAGGAKLAAPVKKAATDPVEKVVMDLVLLSSLQWRKPSVRWRRLRRTGGVAEMEECGPPRWAGGAMEMEEGGRPRSGAVEMLAGGY